MHRKKVTVSWSGGKDSALALYKILKSDDFEVVSLHTTFDESLKRVGLHGIPEALIEQQAVSIGLPLEKIYVPADKSHASYEMVMKDFCLQQKEKGVEAIIFGDIFLEDLKAYREVQLKSVGLEGIFPIWGLSTAVLVNEFIGLGFKTLLCCINAALLPQKLLGETLTSQSVKEISALVDPCGENGEFHTFVYNGPIFSSPISYTLGKSILKSYDFKKEVEGKIVEEKVEYWFQEVL